MKRKKNRKSIVIKKDDMIDKEIKMLKIKLKKYDESSKEYQNIIECINILNSKDSIYDLRHKSHKGGK